MKRLCNEKIRKLKDYVRTSYFLGYTKNDNIIQGVERQGKKDTQN